MITKVKVKETKISVVFEDDAIDALLEAVKENGLHVSKKAVVDHLWNLEMNEDRQILPRINGEIVLVSADEFVSVFKRVVLELCSPDVDRWEDGMVQIDFARYLQFTYKFSKVLLLG
jgi:hypothetical protein